ncbi:MAG: ribonuclease H, archaeal HII subfamily [Candidatus Nanosalina sp. J07AB43]|nr:MAG: ribonuclease H, archaeal HII subfamily [Candidatus Nanosalina sp. J07AB43]
MKVLGIDEAGRGPVIGSMFIGGFVTDEKDLGRLEDIGVKDSKKLSDNKRDRIRDNLGSAGDSIVEEFTASSIDSMMESMTINQIEIKGFARVIDQTDPDKVIMDLPEPDAEEFIGKIKKSMNSDNTDMEFKAEHGADDSFPVVSAASIVAKSARESHVEGLHSKYGYDFASGYPHDKPTITFLERYLDQEGDLPPETRRSWSTAERIIDQHQQNSISDF